MGFRVGETYCRVLNRRFANSGTKGKPFNLQQLLLLKAKKILL